MFKKLYEKIESKIIESENSIVHRIVKYISDEISKFNRIMVDHNSYIRTLKSQQQTIENLLNALSDKYDHGLFIYSEDGKIPTVIRNGKVLTNNMTTSFSIDWTQDSFPNIQFEQIGGTYSDEEK